MGSQSGSTDVDAEIPREKQLCLMEESQVEVAQPDTNNNNQTSDDFFDTSFQQADCGGPRTKHRPTSVAKIADNNEPLIVYSDKNSSITRTVRDQFAVALLKLQTDLEATGRRLSELETAVKNCVPSATTASNRSSTSVGGKDPTGNIIQILYIGWPMIVYIAMRYMERRSLAGKLAQ